MASSKQKMEGGSPDYVMSLPSDVRTRYEQKIAAIGVDPYRLKPSDYGRDRMAWPELTYIDVWECCSWYTKEQMKHYKSLEAYKFFLDDWIREVLHKEINGFHLIKAKVTHSMRVSEKPLEPWIIMNEDGSVTSAHCTCMAGLAEACSHIGAVLFCLEACARTRKEATPTDLPAYWLFPSSTRLDTQFKKIKNMNLQSAKRRRCQENQEAEPLEQAVGPRISQVTQEEEKNFLTNLHTVYPGSGILSISDDFSSHHIPKSVSVGLPLDLRSIYCSDIDATETEIVMAHCESVDVSFNQQQADLVEARTRGQTKNKLWHQMRAGRITASKMHAVCHTSVTNPSVSLLKSICAPQDSAFKAAATEWGNRTEGSAKACYKDRLSKEHIQFELKDCGLFLNPQYPALGASPDGIVTCLCCGEGCLEVKCPFTLKKATSSLNDLGWLKTDESGQYGLDVSHPHYYQIQCQLFVSGKSYCDFVVFAPHLPLVIERIYPNKDFWDKIASKAQVFHAQCILPEVVCKMFSRRQVLSPKKVRANQSQHHNKFCVCQGPDDGRMMVQCSNENCTFKWFHVDCIGMKRIPKGTWHCRSCRRGKM